MTLSLQLVTYNSSTYLPTLFESLVTQKDRDWILYVYDNASEDRELVSDIIKAFSGKMNIVYVEGDKNIGFAGGHQALFETHDAELVMLLNPDVILSPDFIFKMRSAFKANPKLGSASGIIYRWDFVDNRVALSNTIDSLGITELVHGGVVDRGMGDINVECDSDLLGVSGCAPTYRRSAVISSSYDKALFDPRYHSYKEDVDIAYRLRNRGWNSFVENGALAYHRREVRKSTKRSDISYFTQYHSYRNHAWNLLTHMSWRDMVKRGWAILPYEIAKTGYYLLTRPSIVVKAIKETVEYYPEIKKKRAWYAERTGGHSGGNGLV